MITQTPFPTATETTETSTETGTEDGADAVGLLRDRSELVADAARLLEQTTWINESNSHRPDGDVHVGDHATARRAQATAYLQLDQAESLGRLADAANTAGARDALAAETIAETIETAGQNTTIVLGLIAGQLEKLTDTLDAHRLAVLDTAGDLRAEVELLGEDLRGIDRTVECGLDEVCDPLRRSVEDRDDRFGYAEAAWAAGRTAIFFLVGAGAVAYYGDRWNVPSGAAQAITVYGGLIAVLAIVLAVVPAVTARWTRTAVTGVDAVTDHETGDVDEGRPNSSSRRTSRSLARTRRTPSRTSPTTRSGAPGSTG